MNDSDCLSNLVTAQKPRKLEVEIAIVEDVQKAVDDMGTTVDKAEEEKEDFDENILMMLGPRLFGVRSFQQRSVCFTLAINCLFAVDLPRWGWRKRQLPNRPGLSKGQLILLNIQAVLIFLFWAS